MNSLEDGHFPYWVRIHLPDGQSSGLRVVEKSNWAGDGALFSRSAYETVRERQEFDFNRTGVYVLWETEDLGALPRVYIGEADPLRPRLNQHWAQKDFWTNAVAFAAKDHSLNKAHVRHLEAQLIQRARDLKRCKLENGNMPNAPSMSSADKTQADAFFRDMLLCLPVLGIDFFEQPPPRPAQEPDLFLRVAEIRAEGYQSDSGFVVKAGSQARKSESHHIHPYMARLRTDLIDQGVLKDAGETFVFSIDYTFGPPRSGPSTVAGVILGRPASGTTDWKDAAGRTLKELQEQSLQDDE